MQVIQLDIITFSRALVSLGEAIAGFGRAIVDPDDIEGHEGQDEAVTYGEGEFSEEEYDQAQPECDPAQEPEQEAEHELEQEPEADPEEVSEPEPEPEPRPIRKKAEKKVQKEDRIDAIRRVARKLGMSHEEIPHAGRPTEGKRPSGSRKARCSPPLCWRTRSTAPRPRRRRRCWKRCRSIP